jgi:hypothetical protein
VENNHRLRWNEIPTSLRLTIESALGGEVVSALDQTGGFSPNLASRCELSDGRNVFIKAGSPEQNERSVRNLKREIVVTKALPSDFPSPKLILAVDEGDWTVVVFESNDGRLPGSMETKRT